jgi:peptidyl-prolyl cis-trans isomerase SurA
MAHKITTLGTVAMRAIAGVTLALGSVFMLATTTGTVVAEVEQIVAEVNGEPITASDVERRLKFDELSTHRQPSRREVIAELIAEKRKLYDARLSGIDVTDSDVDTAYANMARRMKLTAEQLTAALAHAGVDAGTLKQRIRADIAWQHYTRRSPAPIVPSLRDPPAPRKKKDDGPSWRE